MRAPLDLRQALLQAPDHPGTLLELAAAFRDAGALDQSSRCLETLIVHHPGHPEALFWLSHQRRLQLGSAALDQLEQWHQHGGPDSVDQCSYLCFALARVREQQQRWAEAFVLYTQANQLRKQALGLLNTDAVLYVEQADLMEQLDQKSAGVAMAPGCDNGDDLVFIVGLPRCGSTLVETLLGQAAGATPRGELRALPQAVRQTDLLTTLRADPLDPDAVQRGLQSLAAAYRATLPRGTGLQLDKTLVNYLYLGLIAQTWPAARIVHVLRHPLDQMLSAWKARFREGHHYSLELADLARVQIAYRRLMDHWHRRYPDRLYLCRYEQLVREPEAETRSLARFCGLDWTPHMLEPQHAQRVVRTASFQQVRQPIHRQSIGGWQRYAEQLQPVIEQLQAAGLEV